MSEPSKTSVMVPPSVLLAFFRCASAALLSASFADSESDSIVPVSAKDRRQEILRIQITCLTEAVDDFNRSHAGSADITMEAAQSVLRTLGKSETVDGSIESDKAIQNELVTNMHEMNEVARQAFVRLLLRAEVAWDKSTEGQVDRYLKTSKDQIKMERSAIMEFCGLCIAAVNLPEVMHHLRYCHPLDDKKQKQITDDNASEPFLPVLAQERLKKLHNLLFRAAGYDPEYGHEEIKRIFFTSDHTEFKDDEEINKTFGKFFSAMSTAISIATLPAGVKADGSGNLSDGSTRVLSVSHSEFDSEGTSPGAPGQQLMEEQTDKIQQEQLRIAREAAALQQSILGELLSMEESERDDVLATAKIAHDDFLAKVLKIPSGPDRVQFVTNIDPSVEKQLLMHKLWEKILAQNDGKPPTMRNTTS
eukprot:scaffold20212_cov54-Attheya_sp.AAC.5